MSAGLRGRDGDPERPSCKYPARQAKTFLASFVSERRAKVRQNVKNNKKKTTEALKSERFAVAVNSSKILTQRVNGV